MSDGFIETKSSRLRNGSATDFKEVVFVSHRPKAKQPLTSKDASKSSGSAAQIDMKKARSEIMRFAMNGMVGQEKRLSKQALAISLGALPEKRKRVNYKVLKEQRKKEKELSKTDDFQAFSSSDQKALLSSKVLNRKALSKGKQLRNKKQSDILGVYGKVKKSDIKL